MIKTIEPILDDVQIDYYKSIVKSSLEFEKPTFRKDGYQNWYLRYNLNEEENSILLNKLKEENYINEAYTLLSSWINVVSSKTNRDDSYHKDKSNRTVIIYLNDDFDGGEFEYYEKDVLKKIKPKKSLSLLMDNNLLHRVAPVKSGVRYSLICFFNINEKNNKTLI